METFYFTFMQIDRRKDCYAAVKAESYASAREEMFRRFGDKWAFQYAEEQWRISKEYYDRIYAGRGLPEWFPGMTQADIFNLRKI